MRSAIYVANSTAGVVKIGRTSDPERRQAAIAGVLRREFGTELTHFENCGWITDFPSRAEADCLNLVRLFLRPVCVRQEWFIGTDYRRVVEIVREQVEAEHLLEIERAERTELQIKRWALRREGVFA